MNDSAPPEPGATPTRTMADLPAVATMTPAERTAELVMWTHEVIVSCFYHELHERVRDLVGPHAWTNELEVMWQGAGKAVGA